MTLVAALETAAVPCNRKVPPPLSVPLIHCMSVVTATCAKMMRRVSSVPQIVNRPRQLACTRPAPTLAPTSTTE